MSEKTDKFINTIGLLARNEYMSRKKWVLPSVCIAQAALESGWNLNAKTLFGIKGKGLRQPQANIITDTMCRYRILSEVIRMLQVRW